MGVLVKTTGPFVIPLGHGEFITPDVSEAEDCEILRSSVARGKAMIIEKEEEKIAVESEKLSDETLMVEVKQGEPTLPAKRKRRN